MADILSLSKARKAKDHAQKEAKAAENRVKFGRTKAEKSRDTMEREGAAKSADLHRRQLSDDEPQG
jgi:hypothetical protein